VRELANKLWPFPIGLCYITAPTINAPETMGEHELLKFLRIGTLHGEPH